MAHWKRLTDDTGTSVDVNLDSVAYMRRGPGDQLTTLFLLTPQLEYITVKETPDEIHLAESPEAAWLEEEDE